MISNARNMPAQPKGLKWILTGLVNLVLGIPSPVGRVRPRAFLALMSMDKELVRLTNDLQASQASNEFILVKNQAQDKQIQELRVKCMELHGDLVRMSKAMKELANHPNVLGPESQEVVNAFKIKH